jgi:hypothetical protein
LKFSASVTTIAFLDEKIAREVPMTWNQQLVRINVAIDSVISCKSQYKEAQKAGTHVSKK